MLKRLISFLLCAAMLFTMLPVNAFATEEIIQTEAVEAAGETEVTEETEETEVTEETEETEVTEEIEETEVTEETEETEVTEETEATEDVEAEESAELTEDAEETTDTEEEEPEVIHEHDYEAVVTEPTCMEQGYTTYTCECGDSYVSDYVDTTGEHTYENGACTICGAENLWKGRSAVFVGDSITAGSGTTKKYFEYLTPILELGSVNGMGIGGSCISSGSDYGNNNTPLINRYKNIPSADLIQIFMGTNDYGHSTPIGSPEDTQAGTFYGALNTIIPYLLETHKESKIVFVTPLHRNAKSTGTTSTSEYDPNASGHTLHDYVEAIKQICATHGVSVIDLYTESEMDPRLDPKNTAYFPDGLHPNAAGHELIARIMESHIREYEPVKIEPIVQTELIQGNKFSASNDQPCRASSRVNYYLKAGTVITLRDPDVMQWACAKTNGEISSTNLGYFPDSQWSDKETAVVAEDGWVGFVFKYRDETQVFDLSKPLSEYITIEEPHTHSYKSTVTVPTCTDQGYTTYTCECGDSYVADLLDATGHTYKSGICTGCGEKLSFEGKTLSILGDSISTYTGVSNDASVNATLKGGAIYYNAGTQGVYRADTWWQQTIDVLGMELLVNNSWSGSTVLHTRSGTAGAYVDRCVQLHNTAGDEPDVIAVFLGTNDFSYYQSALGTANIDYAKLITDNGDGTYTYATPKTTCEAYAVMLHKMVNRYPDAEVYCMNLLPRRNPDHDGKDVVPAPTQFNGELAKVISHFGCTVVDLENCGITPAPENFDTYITDQRVHPGPLGMDQMTQALIDTMMGMEDVTFAVSQNLVNVTANVSGGIVLAGRSFNVALTPAAGFDKLTVTVTMGGKDVTASVYSDGKVNIPAVTGDVVITASATVDDTPNNYCWEISGNNFVNVAKNDLSANTLTKKTGSITDGVIKSAYFQLEKPVVLRHNRPWIVEWRVSGTSWTGMLLSGNVNSSAAGNSYLFKTTQNTGFIGFGELVSGSYHNYGIALASQGVDLTAEHTYRVENRIAADGSNMAYLLVDGKDYGPMNHYYIGGNSNQGKQVDWLNGRDFCFFYIGANGHPLNNCKLDYLTVIECVHTYENGICTGCGSVSEETVANGTCGENLTWTLNKDGVLTISGTGKMYDYGYRAEEGFVVNPPWNAHKNEIITVVIEDGVTNIGKAAFNGCGNLTSVVFSKDLTAIGTNAFSNCSSLANVTLPENLTCIEGFAFSGCSSIESIRIPAGVTNIGSHAFSNCSGLTMVEIPNGVAQISERMFNGCTALASIEIPTGVTGIGDYAFFGCKGLETVELPNGLVNIGDYAFGNCAALTDIMLPESLVSIGNSAFSACSSLTGIVIPDAVTELGNSVFYNCYNLKNVELPANITSIGEWVFYGCGLTSIDIPDSVTHINDYAFYSCDYLTSVEIPDRVVSIGVRAFCDCIRLTSIKLPEGLESIGKGAFENCKSLDKITFTGDAPSIAESAFANVTATVYYPAGNATWTANARQDYGASALTWTSYCDHTYENGICTGCGEIKAGGIWQIVDNNDVIGAYADLQSAIDASEAGGTVRLTANCAVTSGVKIKKDITIDGGNFLVDISGCLKEFIHIEKNAAVTLRALKLDGGATGFEVDYDAVTYTNYAIPLKAGSLDNDPMADTSAILSFGKQLICENVDISNRYTASNGAAMQIRSGRLELTDCDFTHNYGGKQGGALYIANSFGTLTQYPITSVTIDNCTFTENYTGHGGAIYAMNAAEISITDSVFDRNTANGGKGGAIDLPGQNITKPVAKEKGLDYVQTTIDNCVFSNNWAGNDGFAIQSYDSELYITDTEFVGNVGVHPTSSMGTVAIEQYRGDEWPLTVRLDNCLFEGNRGACAAYGDLNSPSELDVTDCIFRGNQGNMSVLLYASNSQFTDCQFAGETVKTAVIDARSYSNFQTPLKMTLTDVSFTDCDADAEILTRKQDHNDSLNTYQIVLQGITNGDIVMQDNNRVSVEGTHTGNVLLDHVTDWKSLTVAAGAAVNGIIMKQPVDGEAKMGERYMVEVLAEGENLKYQWYFKNAGTDQWYKSGVRDNTYDDVMTTARAGREVYCVINDANGNIVTTETAKLICTPAEMLTIVTQPTDGEAVLGERYCVTVEAKGDGLKYQWYFRNKGTNYWTKSSVTDNTYDDVMTTARAGREIYCIITDVLGNKVTTDTVKLVQVPVKLEIVAQPTDAKAAFDELFCATVEAKGEGLKYQWYYRNAGSDIWYTSGVRDNTYDDVMTKARNGREIYCVITDKYGSSVTTDTVKLTAVPKVELKLLGQTYESAAMGERYCVTVEAQGDGLTYQWYFRNAGTNTWYMSGVRDNTYDDVMTKARANRDVYCVITDAHGNRVQTDPVTLFVR